MRERNRPSSKIKRDEKRSKGIKNTRRLGFFAWLLGTGTIEMPRIYCEEFLNLAMRYGFVYYGIGFYDGGMSVRIKIPLHEKKRILCACRAWQIRVRLISIEGLPERLSRLRGRYGIFIGVILSVLLFTVSQGVLWRVDVIGNEELTEEEVRSILAENGLAPGTCIWGICTDSIEQRILIRNDRISWIAINLSGNVASVEIREVSGSELNAERTDPANLIARLDGEIVSLEVYSGFLCVKEGDFVKKGELLASGILESKHSPVRYTRSSGKVFARVSRVYEVEIPLTSPEKVYTGEKIEKKTLIFFGKSIKLFTNYRNLPISCDIMNYVYTLDPFSLGELPIALSVDTYYPYETVLVQLSEEEAKRRAYEALDAEIERDIPDATVLKRSLRGEIVGDRYVLRCELIAICDIAVQREFEVLP